MHKFLLLLLLSTSLFTEPVASQLKEYKLLDKTDSAAIDKELLFALDKSKPGMTMLDGLFKPVKGNLVVYRFLATFRGLSFTNTEKTFHDLLIVETDWQNKIQRAYQYTLEWAEPPLETDLYTSRCKDTYLVNNMTIDKFMFERPWYDDEADRKLKEQAVILLQPALAEKAAERL